MFESGQGFVLVFSSPQKKGKEPGGELGTFPGRSPIQREAWVEATSSELRGSVNTVDEEWQRDQDCRTESPKEKDPGGVRHQLWKPWWNEMPEVQIQLVKFMIVPELGKPPTKLGCPNGNFEIEIHQAGKKPDVLGIMLVAGRFWPQRFD